MTASKILSICVLLAISTTSYAGFPPLPDGGVVHWTKTASKNYTSESGPGASPEETMRPQAEAYRAQCENLYGPELVCVVQSFADSPEVRFVDQGVTYYRWNGGARMVAIPQGPTCDPPMYINEDDECVEPEEICYTNLEEMSDECVLIGPPDEDGLNCVTNAAGLKLCLNDNPLCYTIEGQTACPDPDAVCGWKNGAYNCVKPEEEGCGNFNGERVCFTPDGDKVENDSPDHPDNGGNLDGNENNDETDPRDPTEGGDPNNQPGPGTPIDTQDSDRASEQTARDSLAELKKIQKNTSDSAKALKELSEKGLGDNTEELSDAEANQIIQNGASGSWDDPATGVWGELDEHTGSIGDIGDGENGYGSGMLDGVGDSVTGLIDQGSCQELGFTFKGNDFSLPCDKTKKIRDLLSWVLYILTIWFLFDIVTTPAVRKV